MSILSYNFALFWFVIGLKVLDFFKFASVFQIIEEQLKGFPKIYEIKIKYSQHQGNKKVGRRERSGKKGSVKNKNTALQFSWYHLYQVYGML